MNKIILLALLLSGCSFFVPNVPEPEIIYRKQELICDAAPALRGIDPLPVQFENAINRTGNEVLGISGKYYSNLAINTRQTIEYIKSQKAYINYLKGCIDRHNEKGP